MSEERRGVENEERGGAGQGQPQPIYTPVYPPVYPVQPQQRRRRVKFAARLVRGTLVGFILGFTLFIIATFIGVAINRVAGTTVIDPVALSMFGFGVGFSGPIAIEISRKMEEDEEA